MKTDAGGVMVTIQCIISVAFIPVHSTIVRAALLCSTSRKRVTKPDAGVLPLLDCAESRRQMHAAPCMLNFMFAIAIASPLHPDIPTLE